MSRLDDFTDDLNDVSSEVVNWLEETNNEYGRVIDEQVDLLDRYEEVLGRYGEQDMSLAMQKMGRLYRNSSNLGSDDAEQIEDEIDMLFVRAGESPPFEGIGLDRPSDYGGGGPFSIGRRGLLKGAIGGAGLALLGVGVGAVGQELLEENEDGGRNPPPQQYTPTPDGELTPEPAPESLEGKPDGLGLPLDRVNDYEFNLENDGENAGLESYASYLAGLGPNFGEIRQFGSELDQLVTIDTPDDWNLGFADEYLEEESSYDSEEWGVVHLYDPTPGSLKGEWVMERELYNRVKDTAQNWSGN